MIAGITCSDEMLEALLKLPTPIYRRIEAALVEAFRCPSRVQEHSSSPLAEVEVHVFVSEDVLFVLGDNQRQIQLLRVMLFRPDQTFH